MRPPLAVLVLAFACTCAPAQVPLVDGVPNLGDVGGGVYRSAQPATAEEWASVRTLGVRHVLKLNFEAEGSEDGARDAGLEVVDEAMQPAGDQNVFDEVAGTFAKPDPEQIAFDVALLATAQPGDGWLVHCTHGQDRTGLVVGALRMARDGWTRKAAWDEAIARGYHPELLGLDAAWLALPEKNWNPGSKPGTVPR